MRGSPVPTVDVGASNAHAILTVVAASDGRGQSDGALSAALALQGSEHEVRVLAVLPPIPIVSPEAQLPLSPEIAAQRAQDLRIAVETQTKRVLGDAARWRVEVREGDPAATILDAARAAGADLVITGLGRHGLVDRVFGDETALRLVRLGGAPVMAVPAGFVRAPRCVVVAMDFSQTSVRAARLAIDLAAESAVVHLVHVAPRDAASAFWSAGDWLATYEADAHEELARAAARLNPPPGITIECGVLHGDPAKQILEYAAKHDADLIAAGSHGHGVVARMLIGSVVAKILRGAACGVLITPNRVGHPEGASATGARGARVEAVPPAEWVARLDAFTKRNIGRRGVLEVDDPEIGAQAQERDYPLLGATYDVHDDRLELMLGELGSVRRHLTRGITGVRAIDILTGADGRDVALRIAHGAGQSLLTFIT